MVSQPQGELRPQTGQGRASRIESMSTREQIRMKPAAMTPVHVYAASALQLTTPRFATLQRKCACGGAASSSGDCPECKKKRALQRRDAGGAEPATVPSVVQEVLHSPGQPLESATRAFMEPRFGHDFSRVRVHADARAAQSAAAVNAHAYTLGNHVAFAAGEYSLATHRGCQLLAHELAHVVQQSGQANHSTTNLQIGSPGDPAEKEADRFADAVTRSETRDPLHHGETGGKKPWTHDAPQPSAGATGTLRRSVVVNPPAAAADIHRQFEFLCPGNFSVSGSNITDHCTASTNQSCECLCDAAHDPARTYTLNVQPAVAGTASETLSDGTTVPVVTSTIFPNTAVGANPTVTLPAAGSSVEFGSFKSNGSPEWAEDWRILEHELCGHARFGGGGGPPGNRPGHDSTIDIENAIAAEHGRPARGHFTDRRQGESFMNAVGNRSKVKFFLTNGEHFEAP